MCIDIEKICGCLLFVSFLLNLYPGIFYFRRSCVCADALNFAVFLWHKTIYATALPVPPAYADHETGDG